MVRAAAIALFVAILALVATGIVWVRASSRSAPPGDPDAVIAAATPIATVDVGARYAGRGELLDPRAALPRWHAHPRAQAAALFTATRDCSGARPSVELTDPALAKAWAWHERKCANGDLGELVERAPFMHPSGRSYAALAPAHGDALHVTELATAPASMLDDDRRVLARIGRSGWEALARGDRIVQSSELVIIAEHGAVGMARVRLFDRKSFDALARRASISLVPRAPTALCDRPASSTLCWIAVSSAERNRAWLTAATTASASLAVIAAIVLAVAYRRERVRAHADRLHVLRTLTHELRTPATTLGIDIEPLRAAYDEIPAGAQEPLLRVSDGIARLNRVLHRTARYLELFERTSTIALRPRTVSAKETFDELKDEWPEEVALVSPDVDASIAIDVEWLATAVRNLAENAVRHGKPPAVVAWSYVDGHLVIRVSDGGTSEGLTIGAHRRGAASAGLGLGLAIVARVAELLGGTLSHDPSPTTFVLRVPA